MILLGLVTTSVQKGFKKGDQSIAKHTNIHTLYKLNNHSNIYLLKQLLFNLQVPNLHLPLLPNLHLLILPNLHLLILSNLYLFLLPNLHFTLSYSLSSTISYSWSPPPILNLHLLLFQLPNLHLLPIYSPWNNNKKFNFTSFKF